MSWYQSKLIRILARMSGRNGRLFPSKRVYLEVVWTGVDESIPSLFMSTDNKK